ncbi:MAG: ROK family protein [Bacteroidota bacterium]
MKKVAVGVDLGGTAIKAGLVNPQGKILLDTTVPAEANQGPTHVIEQIIKSVHQLIDGSSYKKREYAGIGVGSPGSVDLDGGTVKYPPNFPGWTVVRLGDALHKEFGLHVEVDNDANAAAVGEAKLGAGIGHKDFIMVTLGTGVGGGLILGGKIFRGTFGGAGELGHITIDHNGPLCNCGNHGCVEAYVGAKYLTRRAIEKLKRNRKSKILSLAGNNTKHIDPKIISLAAKAGDATALDILAETGRYLGIGLATVVNLLDVRLIIIGGGIARAGKPLFDPIKESVRKHVLTPMRDGLEVLPAKLGNSAGILGAAALVL